MYKTFSDFGLEPVHPTTVLDHPLSYCIGKTYDNRFNHGPSSNKVVGQDSKECQLYLADYCAKEFDGLCQVASDNTELNNAPFIQSFTQIPNILESRPSMTLGDITVRNTAIRKYMDKTSCLVKYEPFDYHSPVSPMIREFQDNPTAGGSMGGRCLSTYTITKEQAETLDQDEVMERLLDSPWIAFDILQSIYTSMHASNTLDLLKGKRLGYFFGV